MKLSVSNYSLNKFGNYNKHSNYILFDSIIDKDDKLYLVKKINIKQKKNNIKSSDVFFPKIIKVPDFDDSSLSIIDYYVEKNLEIINLCIDHKFDLKKVSENTCLSISELKVVINDLILRIKDINNKAIENEIKKIFEFQKILFLNDMPFKKDISKKYYFIYLYFDPEFNFRYDNYLNGFIETINYSFNNVFGLNAIVNEIIISNNELFDIFPFHKDLINRVLYHLTKDKFVSKVHNDNYKVTSNIEYLDNELIGILDNFDLKTKKVLENRIIKEQTLKEIGDELGLTRERVRQIENSSLKKMRLFLNHNFIVNIKDYLKSNGYLEYKKIPIQDSDLKYFYVKIISDKRLNLDISYDKQFNSLVGSSLNSFNNIKMGFLNYYDNKNKKFFTKEDLDICLNSFPHSLPNNFIVKVFLEKVFLIKVDDMFLVMERIKSSAEKVALMYELRNNGYSNNEIDLLRLDLEKYFPGEFTNTSERNIFSVVHNTNKVVLWGWGGKYIHKKYMKLIMDEFDFTDVLNYLENVFKTKQKIELESYFEENESELISLDIPNKYAFHSILKEEFDDLFEFHKSPWIAQKGVEKDTLSSTLYSLMDENRIYSIEELNKKLESSHSRIQQIIERTKNILIVDTLKYVRKDFVEIPNSLIIDIKKHIIIKLEELDFIYIDLLLQEFQKELNIFSKYNFQVILLDILRKDDVLNKICKVSNTRISKFNFKATRVNLSFHYTVEKYLMKNRNKITYNEIYEFFIIRGLPSNLILYYYFNSNKIKSIVRFNSEIFYSLKGLGINDQIIDKLNILVYEKIIDEIKLDDLFEEIKLELPKINLNWTNFMISDLLDRKKFNFFPNIYNPSYISKSDY